MKAFDKLRGALRREALPRSRLARIAIGVLLVIGGILGFLPIVGFWMIPLGLAILALDIPIVLRLLRRGKVALGRWRQRHG